MIQEFLMKRKAEYEDIADRLRAMDGVNITDTRMGVSPSCLGIYTVFVRYTVEIEEKRRFGFSVPVTSFPKINKQFGDFEYINGEVDYSSMFDITRYKTQQAFPGARLSDRSTNTKMPVEALSRQQMIESEFSVEGVSYNRCHEWIVIDLKGTSPIIPSGWVNLYGVGTIPGTLLTFYYRMNPHLA